jgi:predicted transposase YdaD
MPKPFDVATKHLVESDPLAWLHFTGLPGESVELIDADLTSVVAEADRILKVTGPEYLAHIELQSSYKSDLPKRTLLYNVVAYSKYGQPVESVVVLLRKEADGSAMSGVVVYGGLTFHYRVIRLWEYAPEDLLTASLALLPLAPLTAISETELPDVVKRIEARFDKEASEEERGTLWTTVFLLMGLKYDRALAIELLKGVLEMKESDTYQYILEQGIEKGIEQGLGQGERRVLLLLGEKRFGKPDASIQQALEAVTSLEVLEQMATRIMEVETWQELLGLV